MHAFAPALRQMVRQLIRSPLFSAAAVATFAIAIGANAAVFSVVDGVLLKPLPFDESDRLVSIRYTLPGLGVESLEQSDALHFTFLDENRSFEGVGLWQETTVPVAGLDEPEQVQAILLTNTTLPLLRVTPAIGRVFSEADDSPAEPSTVMLGHGFWRSRFGGDPGVIGRTLTVNGVAREVIGVLPADLQFLDYEPAIYLPIRIDRENVEFSTFNYQGVARLRPGVTIEQANADVARMVPLAMELFPGGLTAEMLEQAAFSPRLRPLKQDVVGEVGDVLWVLLGTVGLVLLIACANIANLFLVRANERQTEVAIRTAMGASRMVLIRESLTESLTIGLMGGVVGLMLAWLAVVQLQAVAPQGLPRLDEITIGPTVVVFTFGVAVLAGLLSGLVPLTRLGGEVTRALKEGGGRGVGAGKRHSRMRDGLVVVQIALALVLLVGAGLMIRTLLALGDVRPGFENPDEVLTARVSVPSAEIPDRERVVLAYEQMLGNLEAIPGVVSAGASTRVTMERDGMSNAPFAVEEFPAPEGQVPPPRRYKWVLPGYFETMRNPVLAGRSVTWDDVRGQAPVAVITENLAREYWGDPREAIGKRIRDAAPSGGAEEPRWHEIVGVVGDVRDDGVAEDPVATVYWPASGQRTMTLTIRTPRVNTEGFFDEVEAAIWSVNSNLPLANVQTLRQILDGSMARASFALVTLMIAAVAALLLAAVGIYGVTAYAMMQRRHEVGVRIALGARYAQISRLVLRQSVTLTALGAAAGLVIAAILTQVMSAILYRVSSVDPLTFVVVLVFIGGTTMLATWIPIRRAARLDPIVALRAE